MTFLVCIQQRVILLVFPNFKNGAQFQIRIHPERCGFLFILRKRETSTRKTESGGFRGNKITTSIY